MDWPQRREVETSASRLLISGSLVRVQLREPIESPSFLVNGGFLLISAATDFVLHCEVAHKWHKAPRPQMI